MAHRTPTSTLPTATLSLVTLGAARLDADAGGVGAIASIGLGKPLALITYLALAPQQTAGREHLCDLLWGDNDTDSARKALRQHIWLAKRQLQTDVIRAADAAISLAQPIRVDALEMTTAIAANDLERAVALYQGDFLAHFSSPGTDEFERWMALERNRLRALFVRASESLIRRHLDAGRFGEAERHAHRLRQFDPDGDIGWRLLLETHCAAGDRLRARAEADHFQHWLLSEERDPTPTERELLRLVRNLAPTQSAEGPVAETADTNELRAELVGRELEFSALYAAWQKARNGTVQRVQVVAPPGFGKTRLLRDFCSRLRASRSLAIYGRAHPGEQSISYCFVAGLAAALAELPGALGVTPQGATSLIALNPSLAAAYRVTPSTSQGDEALRHRALAMLELVRAVSEEVPFVLAVDDLHWCDPESRAVLSLLSAKLSDERVLFVTTTRPVANGHHHADDVQTLVLGTLTASHVEQLVSTAAELPPAPWAARFCELVALGSRGSPLLVLEALRLCIDLGVVARLDGKWECSDPERLEAVVDSEMILRQRLNPLTASERRLMLCCAMGGAPVTTSSLAAILEWTEDEVGKITNSLERSGLLLPSEAGWWVAHDELADCVAHEADAGTKRDLHARLGAALSYHASPAVRRRALAHLIEAGDWQRVVSLSSTVLAESGPTSASIDARLRDLLGAQCSPDVLRRVRGQLPLRVRHPRLLTPLFVVAVLAVVGAVVGVAAHARVATPVADATLMIGERRDDRFEPIQSFDVSTANWVADRPLTIKRRPTTAPHPGLADGADGRSMLRPNSSEWVQERPTASGMALDLANESGAVATLTAEKGDSRAESFSPDGRQLAISSSRWSAVGHPSIAVIDIATRAARRLTNSSTRDQSARWSPDGSRLVFARQESDAPMQKLCVVDSDGIAERCLDLRGWSFYQGLGWIDRDRVLWQADSGGQPAGTVIVHIDSARVTRTTIPRASVSQLQLDPSGRWVLLEKRERDGATKWRIGSVLQFDQARSVTLEDWPSFAGLRWWRTPSKPSFLDRVEIRRPLGELAPRVPHLLSARGWLTTGDQIAPTAVRWRSLTPAKADIDANGVLVARDTGVAIIEMTSGGWRTTVDTIPIRARATVQLLRERWDSAAVARWRYYGDPLPAIVSDGRGGAAFHNRGDGNYFSGAYSKQTFDLAGGLAIDVDLATPITATQWQLIWLALSSLDRVRLDKWDHRTGYVPYAAHRLPFDAVLLYPTAEGATRTDFLTAPIALRDFRPGLPRALATGAWYHIRLQVLPDGRCGFALNGRAISIGPAQALPDKPLRLLIQGSSVGSKVLVGPVTVTQGVPSDVDWTTLRSEGDVWLRPKKPI